MDVCFDVPRLLDLAADQKIGVISTPAAWIKGCGSLGDFLAAHLDVRAYLALEHGLRGDLQDGVHFASYDDPRTGIPVFSFYGGSHTFPESTLQDLDLVVFHAQDISHRAYTYKQTLAETLIKAASVSTTVIVLDRPTPLGHLANHGPLAPQFFPLPIPVLTAYTLGELALWLRAELTLDLTLEIIPVQGWRRDMPWPETSFPWIPPSPNIPSLESVYAYACTGILQHTSISEGRGTCKPFEYFGAPFVDPFALVERLSAANLPGICFREVFFTPAFNQYCGELCAGAHLMITTPDQFRPLQTMLAILQAFAALCPGTFETTPGFGKWLDGTEWNAERIRKTNPTEFLEECALSGLAFAQRIAPFSLYD